MSLDVSVCFRLLGPCLVLGRRKTGKLELCQGTPGKEVLLSLSLSLSLSLCLRLCFGVALSLSDSFFHSVSRSLSLPPLSICLSSSCKLTLALSVGLVSPSLSLYLSLDLWVFLLSQGWIVSSLSLLGVGAVHGIRDSGFALLQSDPRSIGPFSASGPALCTHPWQRGGAAKP